ncbi:MAG TPA: ATP-dependent Clp protease ATP-binding subunit, partial [Phaeodactylibacter sp.]|nr:ATP-dependent Clp protease ATP-binding subunit [Phaeodactylibacter sp.]
MSTTLTIPFFAFRLHFASGGSVSMPLHKPSAVRMKQTLQKISGLYANEFQKYVIDKGDYEKILEEWQDGDFFKSEFRVGFPAAKNGFSFPPFDLAFDFFYKKTEKGYWLIIPALALEAFAEDENQVESALVAATRLEFERNKRLSYVEDIVAAIWYEDIELLRDDISLKIHTPSELKKVEEETKEAWLPQVATLLEIKEPTTYGREEEMNRLTRAIKASFSRNILLMGASGVGKTALIYELSFRKKQYNYTGQIWETSASALIKELVRDTGWQDNIAHLVKELTVSGDILFVRNLLELFEVGRYEGNSISIAEYLLTYISRGEVNIISECTEEEKSIIELRSPNFLTNFQIITLTEPQKDLEDIILKKVQDLAKKHKAKIDAEAIKETIRLNKRFTPYSGFPGKPIRFLESILLNQMDKATEKAKLIVSRSEVIRYFCEETGMPLFMVDPEIPMSINRIKTNFNHSVFGQNRAVDGVMSMLSAVKAGLAKTGKPISSFLFVGPTGVGKTELAKVLAEFMFGSRDKMVRF